MAYEKEMLLMSHIEELIRRVYVCLFSIILFSIISIPITPHVISYFKN